MCIRFPFFALIDLNTFGTPKLLLTILSSYNKALVIFWRILWYLDVNRAFSVNFMENKLGFQSYMLDWYAKTQDWSAKLEPSKVWRRTGIPLSPDQFAKLG